MSLIDFLEAELTQRREGGDPEYVRAAEDALAEAEALEKQCLATRAHAELAFARHAQAEELADSLVERIGAASRLAKIIRQIELLTLPGGGLAPADLIREIHAIAKSAGIAAGDNGMTPSPR